MPSQKFGENWGTNEIFCTGLCCSFLVALVSDFSFEADSGRIVSLIVARQHVDFLCTSSIPWRVLRGI